MYYKNVVYSVEKLSRLVRHVHLLKKMFIFIEVQLIYNVLVSGVQQSDSVVSIIYIFFSQSFPL